MKPGHDGSVALIDTDTQDLRQEVKKDIAKLELKIGWVKSDLIWWVVVMHLGTLAAIFAILLSLPLALSLEYRYQ